MPDTSIPIDITAGNLPANICAAINSEQDRLNAYVAVMSASLTMNGTGIAIQVAPPADTTVAWLKLDATTLRPVGLYRFIGNWISPHPLVPGLTMIWTAALPDFNSFDGGDGGAPSAISGPMWEEATELRARFPIGAGTTPTPYSTVLAQGATGGEEKHVLVPTEIPPVNTLINFFTPNYLNGGSDNRDLLVPSADSHSGQSTYTTQTGDPGSGNPPTAAAGHGTMPLFYVVYFIRRTSRTHYRS